MTSILIINIVNVTIYYKMLYQKLLCTQYCTLAQIRERLMSADKTSSLDSEM